MSDGRAVRGVDSCNSQTLLSRVRVRLTARADTCLGWDTWRYPVIWATRRPNKDPSGGQNTMRRWSITPPKLLTLCEKYYQMGNCNQYSFAPLTGGSRRIGSQLGSDHGEEQHHEEIAQVLCTRYLPLRGKGREAIHSRMWGKSCRPAGGNNNQFISKKGPKGRILKEFKAFLATKFTFL